MPAAILLSKGPCEPRQKEGRERLEDGVNRQNPPGAEAGLFASESGAEAGLFVQGYLAHQKPPPP